MKSTLYPHTRRQVSPAEVTHAVWARLAGEAFGGRGPDEGLGPAQLGARAELLGASGLGGRLYLQREDGDPAPPYGVVLQERPAGGSRAGHVGERTVTVLVRFECSRTRARADAWHSVMHGHTFTLLQGFFPRGLATAATREAFEESRSPDTPMNDSSSSTLYSRSGFTALFQPRSS